PTHRNTQWDAARYEVAAHHWADLGDAQWGVSLINDCKYAYDIQENVMRLTLLKSATYPDATADAGEHAFTYRLYAREGDTAWQVGYDLNYQLLTYQLTDKEPEPSPLVIQSSSEFIIETVKLEEDGRGMVLRGYSTNSHHTEQNLTLAMPIRGA